MSKKLNFSLLNSMRWCSSDCEYGELKSLSKMQARRLSPIGKKIIDMSISCIEKAEVDYVVYASRHGELNLSIDLIQMLMNGDIPSPMKFSQSTHNSIASQFCVQSNKKVPVSAISAGEKSFGMGVLAACNHLISFPQEKVLFIFADAGLPDVYKNKVSEVVFDTIYCGIFVSGDDHWVDVGSGVTDINV